MSRRINEADFQKALKDGKIDPKATREARRDSMAASPETETDHPLIAQGKAMQSVAEKMGEQGRAMESVIRELGVSLKGQGGDAATTIKVLTALVQQNNDLVRQMMTNMAAMHRTRQTESSQENKRKPWKLKVNRNASGFTESIDIVPSGD